MTFPPCYLGPDDEEEPTGESSAPVESQNGSPPDPSRRSFLIGSASATAGFLIAPMFARGSAESDRNDADAAPTDASAVPVTLLVNGRKYELKLDPRTSLLDALREHLHLTGTKKGCDQGACGACTVLVAGRRVNSCLTFAIMQGGLEITTIEGLAGGERLHPVQAAFIRNDGFQCGYCTSGQICSAVALLQEGHTRTDDEIREWMSGNLCRCGAYTNIVAAIREAEGKRGSNASV